MSIKIWLHVISSSFLGYHANPSTLLHLYSWLSLLHHYGCHKRQFCSEEWGPASTETAMDGDDWSCSFCCSFHICFFFFSWWCDPRSHHSIVLMHGCSPWLFLWWVVSGEYPCRSYSMTTGSPWWFRHFSISFSRGVSRWGWWWWEC